MPRWLPRSRFVAKNRGYIGCPVECASPHRGVTGSLGCVIIVRSVSATERFRERFLSLEAFSECTLALHQSCRQLGLRAFQAFLFERLRLVLSFDSGLLATGTVQNGVPEGHDIYLDRQPPELLTSWEKVKELDRVAMSAVGFPGRTGAFVAREIYAGLPAIQAHCELFTIRHLLTTAQVSERAGGYVVLSLYRHEQRKAFREPERAWIERIVPHIVECLQQCHLAELQRATEAPASATVRSAAIVNRRGVILDAEPAFIELLARHHPRWRGPFLPADLASITQAATHRTNQVAGKLALTVHPSGDLMLLRVRPVLPIDALSSREREVVELFAAGETTRQIGARLNISTNTVRVHVSRAYDKLGVVNKAELASMLSGAD